MELKDKTNGNANKEVYTKRGKEQESERQENFSLNEYQKAAYKTAGTKTKEQGLCATGLGLTGEAGETADYIKKVLLHGHSLDKQKLARELGDVLWYVALGASTLQMSLSEIAQINIDKLKKRYPEGFSEERSINRPDKE